MNGDSRASQRISSTQERPMPGDRRAGREAAGGGGAAGRSAAANSSSGGAGQASGPSVATISSSATASRGSSFAQAALLGAELAQAQLAAVGEPDQHPRGAVAQRRPLVEQLQPPGRHQVDQQGERARAVAGRTRPTGILPIRRTPVDPARRPARRAAGLEGLQRGHPGRQRRLDLGALERRCSSRRAVISTSGSSGMTPEGRARAKLWTVHSPVSTSDWCSATASSGRRGQRTSNVEGAARRAGASDRQRTPPPELSAGGDRDA